MGGQSAHREDKVEAGLLFVTFISSPVLSESHRHASCHTGPEG